MASDAQRARRRAQRQVAINRQNNQRNLPPSITRPAVTRREAYIDYLRANPDKITPADHKELARRASYAEWQDKKPGSHPHSVPEDANQWAQFFYHKDK